MSRLLLCGKADTHSMFQLAQPRFGLRATITVAEMPLVDLIPLVWKLPVVMEYCGHYDVVNAAAELLFVTDREKLLAEHRQRILSRPQLVAGDFIVVLPMIGYGGEFVVGQSQEEIVRWFDENKVKVAFIGDALPADIAQVFRNVNWQASEIYKPCPLAAAVEASAQTRVSVYDAVRAKICLDGIERFQKEHFPDKVEVALSELLPHIDGYHVAKLLCHKLGIDHHPALTLPDMSPVANALGLKFSPQPSGK